MDVLVLSNGKFEVKSISNELEALHEIVGGYIEIPHLSDTFYENGIDIIINEEGKFIDGMQKEIAVVDKSSNVVLDVIFGNCIFAGHNEDGETIGLTENQMRTVQNMLSDVGFLGDNTPVRVLYI